MVQQQGTGPGPTPISQSQTQGLTGDYYDDRGAVTSEVDPAPSASIAIPSVMSGDPNTGETDLNFTVIWSGYLKVSQTGTYTVTIDLGASIPQMTFVTIGAPTNDPVSLYQVLADGTIFNQYHDQVQLTAGQSYPIIIDGNLSELTQSSGVWSPRAFITNTSGVQTTLTSSNFAPAVVPNSIQNLTEDFDAPDGAYCAWDNSDTPSSIAVFRYSVGDRSQIYFDPYASIASGSTSYSDASGVEGQDLEYDLKEVYNNPVTGTPTYGPAVGEDIQMPYQVGLNPADTGNGQVTLFWSAPPQAASFQIYEDASAGSPSNLIAFGTTSQFADTRYGQTNSYLYTLTGLALGVDKFYTVKALDSNGNVIHVSDQVRWPASAEGIPWNSTDSSSICAALYQALESSVGSGADYLDFVGPNHILYSVAGGTSYSWQKFEPSSPCYDSTAQPFTDDSKNSDHITPKLLTENSSSFSPTTVPVKGSSAGPYDKFETEQGFQQISATFFLPGNSSDNFSRAYREVQTKKGPVLSGDAFDLYLGGDLRPPDGRSVAIDAGLSWDSVNGVSNKFWSPIINIQPDNVVNFWDGGTWAGNTSPDLSHGQYNGNERIYFPPGSNGPIVQVTFEAPTISSYGNGCMLLMVSPAPGQHLQLCDAKGNLINGSSFVLGAYNPKLLTKYYPYMQVKATASIAQPGVPANKAYVNDGSYFKNWQIGDYYDDSSSISINGTGKTGGLIPWDIYTPLNGYWTCSPNYGPTGFVIQTVLGQTSNPFTCLFNYILTSGY